MAEAAIHETVHAYLWDQRHRCELKDEERLTHELTRDILRAFNPVDNSPVVELAVKAWPERPAPPARQTPRPAAVAVARTKREQLVAENAFRLDDLDPATREAFIRTGLQERKVAAWAGEWQAAWKAERARVRTRYRHELKSRGLSA